jgi:hypothetical protein
VRTPCHPPRKNCTHREGRAAAEGDGPARRSARDARRPALPLGRRRAGHLRGRGFAVSEGRACKRLKAAGVESRHGKPPWDSGAR